MNKKKFTYITALTLLSFTLMTGCTNERKENQTAYRQIGINAMESGDYAGIHSECFCKYNGIFRNIHGVDEGVTS